MRIDFDLNSYADIVVKYWDLLSHESELETEEADDEFFIIKPYRVVVPEYGISFREGEWFVKDPFYEEIITADSNDDYEEYDRMGYGFTADVYAGEDYSEFGSGQDAGPWQSRGKVIIIYEDDETDVNEILDYTTAGLEYTINGYLKKSGDIAYSGDASCFIETDEFIDENTAYMFLPADDEEE